LTEEIVAFARAAIEEDPTLRARDLVVRIEERFSLSVHPRSIERALAASPKAPAGEPAYQDGADLARRYEELRRRVLCGEIDGHRLGLSVLLRQGVTAWMRAACSIPTAPAPHPRHARTASPSPWWLCSSRWRLHVTESER